MDHLILANATGETELRVLDNDIDFDIGGDNDFELSMPASDWASNSMEIGQRLYIPGTEYGGVIGEIESRTSEGMVYVRGWTWRGILNQYILQPPSGSDYLVLSGDLNTVAVLAIGHTDIYGAGMMFGVDEVEAGASVTNYRFDRYCTALEGLEKCFASVGYRIQIKYHDEEIYPDTSSECYRHAFISAVPIVDYSETVELSQHCDIEFTSKNYARGSNTLYCLGSGELKDRLVVPVYAMKDGFAGTYDQCVAHAGGSTGDLWYERWERLCGVYDNNNEDDETALAEAGVEKLLEVMPYQTFEASMGSAVDIDMAIGDTIGGRDYITGQTITKPITQKILTVAGGVATVSYKMKGES